MKSIIQCAHYCWWSIGLKKICTPQFVAKWYNSCTLKMFNCQQHEWMFLKNIPPHSILFSCYVIPFDEHVELNTQCISGIILSKYLFSIQLDFKTMFYGFHELWSDCIVRPYKCTYKSCYQSSINLSLLNTHTHTHTHFSITMFHVTYSWCFCRGSWTVRLKMLIQYCMQFAHKVEYNVLGL